MAKVRGYAYPLSVFLGELETVEDDSLIEAAIRSVLLTRPGERVMRPLYGLNLQVFDTLQQGTSQATLSDHIQRTLTNQVGPNYPGVSFDVLVSTPDTGRVTVGVQWSFPSDKFPRPLRQFELFV